MYLYKQMIKKPAQIHSQSKRPHSVTKMNDNINMDSTNCIVDECLKLTDYYM